MSGNRPVGRIQLKIKKKNGDKRFAKVASIWDSEYGHKPSFESPYKLDPAIDKIRLTDGTVITVVNGRATTSGGEDVYITLRMDAVTAPSKPSKPDAPDASSNAVDFDDPDMPF